MNKRKLGNLINKTNYDNMFLTKEEANRIFICYKEYMGGELYIIINGIETKLCQLLEGDSDQKLLPGQYSLYMRGPQGTSLWIRNNNGIFQFYEYYDRDIYANPQDKYFNAFKNRYEERKFDIKINFFYL
jgi:hypothetical protein